MKHFPAVALALFAFAGPLTAHAEEKPGYVPPADRFADGFIPAFRWGHTSMDREDQDGVSTAYSGYTIAFDTTYHYVLPGDRFALGVNGGIFMVNGSNGDLVVDYTGWELGPVVEVGIIERLFLQARVNYLSASDTFDQGVTGFRYGGGATAVIWRVDDADAALQLDLTRTSAKTAFASGERDLSAFTISVGLLFSIAVQEAQDL